MNNKLPSKGSSVTDLTDDKKGSKGIGTMLLPFMAILLTNQGGFNFKKLNLDTNLDEKIEMLDRIKNYFYYNDQVNLCKAKDVLEILNKMKKIKREKYNEEVSASTVDQLTRDERKERIIEELINYSEGKNRDIMEKALTVKKNLQQVQTKVLSNRENAVSSVDSSIEPLIMVAKSFEPVMNESSRKTIRKLEKIIRILRESDDEF
ncbi:hypothetical protein [Thermohalobacter berrensis]|uniref:Uncharacterized protein n=1 Tax=Thermohalobacter berrensis TaxID=99594 RepID=A0A419SZ71_9FIRM|nr:hypothetical protein [Thermohalobacter berrensis]RKD30562.1 hypothetical protein BET03_04290 [Thermohalobacter berrensis]